MALLSALTKAKDELVKLGYPEQVAENIVSGRLDMRSPARLERQKDLNPDIFYTGTTSPDIINTPPSRNEIGTGISPQFLFGSESPALAASYAGKKQGRFADESPTIYPFAIDTTGFDRLLGGKNFWNALENPRIELGGDPENIYTSPGIGYHTDDIAQMSYELGSPGLLMQDVIDPGPYTKLMRMGLQGKKENASQFEFDNFLRGLEQAPPTNVVVPDTTRVRSLFGAAFDPEYKGSNILGDRAIPVAGAGLLAASALAPEEAEAGVGADQRLVADPQRPTRSDARALEMKPYTGRITDDILRGLEARGVNVNANPMVTAAAVAAGQEAEGLLAQLPQKDSEAYNYSDVLPIKRSKDPEAREGLLGGYSPAYTGVVEDMIEGLLKFSTQAKRGIYNPAAASEFLL